MTGYISTEKVQKKALLSNFTPSIMAPQVLEDILVQRHELAADLVDRIIISITTENKHYPLLIGARGMGKTHLVSIVYNRIKQRENLQDLVMIGWLREEEWGISSWLDLVVRIFRSIGEEYPNTEIAEIAIDNITILQTHSPTEAEVLAESLLAELVGKKTLFLIIENLDDVFDGLGTNGRQRLRSFLQEYKCCTILATTPVLFNGITSRNEAFYGWFTPFHLQPFTHPDAIELLTNIATQSGDQELASFLRTPAGSARVRAVHRLAGGNPRGYTLFAQLITKQDLDSLVGAFMKMLDDLMPYYQSRMAMLSPQQRKIVAHLVDNTEAIIVKDIATWCFATPQTVASQLKDLKAKGYVVSSAVGKESYYELTEVLMRLCLEVKKYRGKEVESLVEMIRIWYRPEEIKAQFDQLMSVGNLEHARYYELALEDSRPDPVLIACQKDLQKFLDRGDLRSALKVWEELVDRHNISLEKSRSIAGLIISKEFDGVRIAIRDLLDTEQRLGLLNKIETLEKIIQGINLCELKKWEDALVIFSNHLEQNPKDESVMILYGISLRELGRYKDAIINFNHAIEINVNSYEAWNERGVSLHNAGRYEEAIFSYDHATEINPNRYDALNNRGVSLVKLGRYEEAIANYNCSIEINPDDSDVLFNRGIALGILERYDDAIHSFDRSLATNPQQQKSWYSRGLSLGKLGKNEEAITNFDQALELDQSCYVAWIGRGVALVKLGRYEEAIHSYDRALQISSGSDVTWHDRGNILFKMGMLEEAITNYNHALEINANRGETWYLQGITLFELGRYDDAITSFDRAIELKYDGWCVRGISLFNLGMYEEAVDNYDNAIEINQDDEYSWSYRGKALDELGKYEEAITSLDRAIQIKHNYHEAWHSKGIVFYKWGKYREALDTYQQAIDIKPDAYDSWYDRGLAFFQLGNFAEALDAWRSAFKIIHDLQPSDTSNLIQELLDGQLLAKFQQPTVRDLIPQLLEIYIEADVLPSLGVALTRNIKALISAIISDHTANEWLKLWQKLGKPHPELGLALKMVAAGVKYKKNPQDKRIFLALPQELRPLMREALGIE
jgi:tetratricopeptide (TPR) repeat protein